MPVQNYGIWKAHPVQYTLDHAYQDPRTPHLSLYFTSTTQKPTNNPHAHHKHPDHIPKPTPQIKDLPHLQRAALNIQSSPNAESRLIYWINETLNHHHLTDALPALPYGFTPIDAIDHAGLDYIRGNLFNVHRGRMLEPASTSPSKSLNNDNNNPLLTTLEPHLQQAIAQHADLYIFGSQFASKNGMHDVHMNQGNGEGFRHDDGVWQDGGLILHYPDTNNWVGVFMAFASQAAHTDDEEGHALCTESGRARTWEDVLGGLASQKTKMKKPGRGLEDSVAIVGVDLQAQRPYRLGNRTTHPVSLTNWSIHNARGQTQALPRGAVLEPRSLMEFELPMCPLSGEGDTITLLNGEGLKVHGVSYSAQQIRGKHGPSVVFAQ
ncbi:uncharacterized protein BO97DRAFT_398074 [Aspergillus homomorphus CBS 101889]|uniref:Uncharacterized protein n=1 Tax=Aspergillus homomorphus (strain CBS 101889) TaxID=1450537 RepID=A0A395HKM8_ASPHC|nr:hypothetical protein BO97DRAFT_398074 [Aspergillus homomorphus CBS 101889]RAL08501.1 hypothetical protein BO97DRAFT_398074 [Aspergillus homomorphus CBS 101889]